MEAGLRTEPPQSMSSAAAAGWRRAPHSSRLRNQVKLAGSDRVWRFCKLHEVLVVETREAELGGDASGLGDCLVCHAPRSVPGALRQALASLLGSAARFGLDDIAQKGHP